MRFDKYETIQKQKIQSSPRPIPPPPTHTKMIWKALKRWYNTILFRMMFSGELWKDIRQDARWNAEEDYKEAKKKYLVSFNDKEEFIKKQYYIYLNILVNAFVKPIREDKLSPEIIKRIDESIGRNKKLFNEKNSTEMR